LEYRSSAWAFVGVNSDTSTSGFDVASSATSAVQAGVWTQVVGKYDATTKTISLYVNGTLVSSVAHAANFNAGKGFIVGRGLWSGTKTDYFGGRVDEAYAYDRALTDDEVKGLSNYPAIEQGQWHFNEATSNAQRSTVSGDTSGNFHTLVVSDTGLDWQADSDSANTVSGSVRLNGTNSGITTRETVLRTDQSFSVMAMVKLDGTSLPSATQTFVSQDGSMSSGFYLQYRADSKKWTFMMTEKDATDPNNAQAKAIAIAGGTGLDPVPGTWTQLTGVYDAPNKKLYIYVNATYGGTATALGNWNAAGNLQIGRAKWNGNYTDGVTGSVDAVHAYSGVVSTDLMAVENTNPVTTPQTALSGMLTRFVNYAGTRFTSTSVVPSGYHVESQLGLPTTTTGSNTTVLYSCLNGASPFSSVDPGCEATKVVGVLGRIYTTSPTGVATIPLLRCKTSSGGYFDSNDTACEGSTVDKKLGYVLGYKALLSYGTGYGPSDRVSSIGGLPANYVPGMIFGYVPVTSDSANVPLYQCQSGTDRFSSLSADCGGVTINGGNGNLLSTSVGSTDDDPNSAIGAIYGCVPTGTTDRFEAISDKCNTEASLSSDQVSILGYAYALADVRKLADPA
jgi:hypothetical protein